MLTQCWYHVYLHTPDGWVRLVALATAPPKPLLLHPTGCCRNLNAGQYAPKLQKTRNVPRVFLIKNMPYYATGYKSVNAAPVQFSK